MNTYHFHGAFILFYITTLVNWVQGSQVPSIKRTEAGYIKLIDSPLCREDILKHCPNEKKNFNILTCLHNSVPSNDPLSEACQHLIWQAKYNLTKANSITIDGKSVQSCKDDIDNIPDCLEESKKQGSVVSCLIEFQGEVKNGDCKKYLSMVEPLIFSDYRLIYRLVDVCRVDIDRFQCGRSKNLKDQGTTIDCLSGNHSLLNSACKHEIYKIAELQSTDWNNDRPLFIACREDRERFCKTIAPGSGNIYKCLYINKMKTEMSEKCRNKLRLRQQLQQEDFQVNYKLLEACKEAIDQYKCDEDAKNISGHMYAGLSSIILCIESVKVKGRLVEDKCLSEVKSLRYSLLEDHRINPEVVAHCKEEIKYCESKSKETNMYVIHCIMQLARTAYKKKKLREKTTDGIRQRDNVVAKNGVTNDDEEDDGRDDEEGVRKIEDEDGVDVTVNPQCLMSVTRLLKEVNIRDNYDIDPALMQDCAMSILRLCHVVQPGKGKVISCLMQQLSTPSSLDQGCKDRLMEIQYFVSKDFQISNRFFEACKDDMKKLCSKDLQISHQSEHLSCLYRNKYDKLSPVCLTELKQLMMDRALSVDLPIKVQDVCMKDLVRFCADANKRDEEMDCLEVNYDKLETDCQKEVMNVVNEEEEMPMISRLFVDACEPMWQRVCKFELQQVKKKKKKKPQENPSNLKSADNNDDKSDNDDDDDVSFSDEEILKCLIQHKNDEEMPHKCKTGIEHHQIMSLKSIELSPKLNKSCSKDIRTHCSQYRDKISVVRCLSEMNLNDTLMDQPLRIRKKCMKQLQFEQLQIRENIKLDPVLAKECQLDIKNYCSEIKPGQGAVLECLKKHQQLLSHECNKMVFKRELDEAVNPLVDYIIMNKCKHMIKEYCSEYMNTPKLILDCLKKSKDEDRFDMYCRDVVNDRLRLRASDIRLNPTLKSACMEDINKNCQKQLEKASESDTSADGVVIACLKGVYAHNIKGRHMTTMCKHLVHEAIKDAVADYVQDVALVANCRALITNHCSQEALRQSITHHGPTDVVDCLKEKLLTSKELRDNNPSCLNEILRKLNENEVDFQVDPILYRACFEDSKTLCPVTQGEGRVMSCLVDLYNKKVKMSSGCNKALKDRTELWNLAIKLSPPETLAEAMEQIQSSNSKNYFVLIIFSFSFIIFFTGLLCGRVTKKIKRQAKIK